MNIDWIKHQDKLRYSSEYFEQSTFFNATKWKSEQETTTKNNKTLQIKAIKLDKTIKL